MSDLVAFRFAVSDWTLFSVRRALDVRSFGLEDAVGQVDVPTGSAGMMLRSMPAADDGASIGTFEAGGRQWLRYVLYRFPRYYIDMAQTFDDYAKKFSGKTRSTIARKVRKFAESADARFERFTTSSELHDFWPRARQLSAKTYQERLLDAGLPSDEAFVARAERAADAGRMRAFLLSDGDRPVSYLYCPVHDGTVVYAYLGYDPEYRALSPGTVLQWMALESLFSEQRFRFFDFTEGESEHKRLFSTDQRRCANVALLRPTLANRLLAHSHWRFGRAVEAVGAWLQAHELKTKVRRWMRRAA